MPTETARLPFDTSGCICIVDDPAEQYGFREFYWFDLAPFTQGYIEALLGEWNAKRKVIKAAIPADLINAVYKAEGWIKVEGEVRTRRVKTLYDLGKENRPPRYTATPRPAGFSDLAPETLTRILEDCERYTSSHLGHVLVQDGQRFWKERWLGHRGRERFPPLAPYLGDDGKVYLKDVT